MRAALTRTLLLCCGITAAIHLASTVLNTLLPFHVVALGGSKTQVGLLFSVTTIVSMFLRPVVGGWIDRYGVRPILLPGVLALAGTSIGLQLAGTAEAVIALMVGLGLANGLVSTTSSVLAAQTGEARHRGEALGTYYLASSLAVAVAPPAAFGLSRLGGMPLAFLAVSALAAALGGLAAAAPAGTMRAGRPGGARLRFWSGSALVPSIALVLTTVGHSSIYAFLPLYAISRGQGRAVALFFSIYPMWLLGCRAALRQLSDRIGRTRVIAPAMVLQAAGYFALVLSPTPASVVLAALFLATGSSVLYPTLAALVVDRAPEGERGLALGTLSGAWDLGVVVGSAAVGLVVERGSYGAGFAVGGLGALLGLAAFTVGERPDRRPAGRPVKA